MLEKNTDRLFWTLTSIIVGALLLTISVKAFPSVAETAISPITGIVKQADTVGHKSDDTANKAFSDANNFGNSSSSHTNAQPTDPDVSAKANAVEASTLGLTVTNNGDGTGTIAGYNTNKGLTVNIPKYVKVNGTLLKITSIGQYAFCYNQLTSVNIPDSVTSIDSNAFDFNRLTSINIPNSVTSIGIGAFANNALTSINIPNSVTSIGIGAFEFNRLTSINIPNSVTSIGQWAFMNNSLPSVTIPNSVTSIGGNAFYNNKLTSVNIPNAQAYQQVQANQSNSNNAAFDPSVTVTNNHSSN